MIYNFQLWANAVLTPVYTVDNRVRSRKHEGTMHGTIIEVKQSHCNVKWDNGFHEWCFKPDLRTPLE